MDGELVQLDSIYADPGFLLLARDADGERLGCVGLRLLDDSDAETTPATGEVRRLFVREAGRRRGIGVALVEKLLENARADRFERLVLNTVPTMSEAIRLYRRLGFELSEPYVADPLEDTLYYALDL